MDGWATFRAPARVGVLVKALKAQLSAVLADKIQHPALDMSSSKAAAVIMRLLSTDGF